jgi:hypothetical protein
VFYLMEGALLDAPAFQPEDFSAYYNEVDTFNEESGGGQSMEAAVAGEDAVAENYFSEEPHEGKPIGAMAFASYAFIAAVFMPTAALLATIGTIGYITRMYGEEIDLSRIVQMI